MAAARRLIFIVGTSGSGKGTIISMLKERHPEFLYPASLTTRAPRPGEVDGETYFFVSRERFEEAIAADELLEWDTNHEREYYGILKGPVLEALKEGKVVVREIGLHGLEEILKTEFAPHIRSVFLMPPSVEVIRSRILKRSTLPDEEVERRLNSALAEIAQADLCDTQIKAEEGHQEEIYRQLEEFILSE